MSDLGQSLTNHLSATRMLAVRSLAVLCFSLFSVTAVAEDPAIESEALGPEDGAVQFGAEQIEKSGAQALAEIQAISKDIQNLKGQVIDLNKDLRLMEEKLLYPSSTKYSVFVSMATGQFFQLEGIKFKLDGEFVATHVYSDKQRAALARGGVHRLYITNLSEGKHTATVFFTGIGSNQRAYKRAVSLDFEKGAGSEYLEIAVSDDGATQEPVFELKQW